MPAFTLPVLLPTEIFHECSAGSRNTGLAPLLRFTTTHPIRKTPCSRKPTCHLQVHTLRTTSSSSPLPPLHSSPFTRSLDFFSAARRQLRPHLRNCDPSLTRRSLHFPAVSVVHPHRLFPCRCGEATRPIRKSYEGRYFKHKKNLARKPKRWETEYNEDRSHLALKGKTPFGVCCS